MSDDFYTGKSDLDVARHINLSLLMCNGISEQDAGFDKIVSLNETGLDAVARIVNKLRAMPLQEDGKNAEIERLETFIEFVLRWITDEKVTPAERVSIVRHHPRMQGMLARRAVILAEEGTKS